MLLFMKQDCPVQLFMFPQIIKISLEVPPLKMADFGLTRKYNTDFQQPQNYNLHKSQTKN